MGKPADQLWNSQPRTILKHQAYRSYVGCWMGKVCQRFPIASIVDAFAGPGAYKDGPDGSPLVIAKAFLEHTHHGRFDTLRLLCVEERTDRRDHLDHLLASLTTSPKLHATVFPPGRFADNFSAVAASAHAGARRVPTLWILDPFDLNSVPFDLVRQCLQFPNDEVLITFFVDEIYRLITHEPKHVAYDRYFGTDQWELALLEQGESDRKQTLLDVYQQNLESLPGVRARRLAIACKNETPRYALFFATHHRPGLDCFNSTAWRMDPYRGGHVSEKTPLGQVSLFDGDPVVSPLRSWVVSQAGRALTFAELSQRAAELKFKDSHLRTVLSELAADGIVVRQAPLDSRSPWPADCLVRIYSAEESATVAGSPADSAPD